LVFRKVTERQEGIDTGGVKLIGLERENVVLEASRLLEDPAAYHEMIVTQNPFGDGNASERIVQAILTRFKSGDRREDLIPSETIERNLDADLYFATSK
jgi:UDP-N-acetylglucosamine 2-epimerase (non-hydrolysing)